MDINIQILIGGRGTGVFLGEQRKDMNEWPTSWKDKCCCFPANREEQQRRGYSGTPEDCPPEGKTIFKLRHKSADELKRQLKQLPHRRSMSGPHKAPITDVPVHAPVCGDKAGRTHEAQNKRGKSSIHKETRQSLHTWKFSSGFCVSSDSGSEYEVCKETHDVCCQSYVTWRATNRVKTVPEDH